MEQAHQDSMEQAQPDSIVEALQDSMVEAHQDSMAEVLVQVEDPAFRVQVEAIVLALHRIVKVFHPAHPKVEKFLQMM